MKTVCRRRRAITRGAKKRNPHDRKKYYDVNNDVE